MHLGHWLAQTGCALILAGAVLGAHLSSASRVHRDRLTPGPHALPQPAPEAEELFEAHVRPLLLERCISCHTGVQPSGGLRLDSRDALLQGGIRGAAVTPGQPETSLLLTALHYDGVLKMPPAGKLPQAEIDALEAWVRAGAPWPSSSGQRSVASGQKTAGSNTAAGDHWAFRKVAVPRVPAVKNREWVKTPVDAFVLAKLEAKGLSPSPQADPRTLIRRAYLDLTGLPPSAEDVEAFVREYEEWERHRRGIQVSRYSGIGSGAPGSQVRVNGAAGVPNTRIPEYPNTPSPYESLIERLLNSPRYGERWGRYWLDVARYADTKDYVYAGERRYPFSHTYRDYVIRSFNEDKPYDRFLVEQIAGDCLPIAGEPAGIPSAPAQGASVQGSIRRKDLAALGFLTLGRKFVDNQADVVDDRIDVVFRGTQGLTVSCARCHDHKFDPIPTKDYYSLYGVFAGSTERLVPLQAKPDRTPAYEAFAAGLEQRQKSYRERLDRRRGELSDRLRRSVAAYLEMVPGARNLPGEEVYQVMEPDDINPIVVRRWRAYIDRKRADDAVFAPWRAFEALEPKAMAARGPALARRVVRSGTVLPEVARLFSETPPTSMAEVARRYGALLARAHQELKSPRAGSVSPALRAVLFGPGSPATIPPLELADLQYYFPEDVRKELNELQSRVDGWYIKSAAAPAHALALQELPDQPLPRVFLRGNRSDKGPEVPRQLPAVLAGPTREPFQHGSGRLELARAIASPDNPLTARVMVNRVWGWHFGRGLVRTPSNFGRNGEAPTHPELLDWLASRFARGARDEGRGASSSSSQLAAHSSQLKSWSVKDLHRLIMLSSTYQQASHAGGSTGTPNSELRTPNSEDPENRLFGRFERRRLDFEALRDTLLAVSGQLDTRMGGRGGDLTKQPFSGRRAVYGFLDRQLMPGLLRTFDVPMPDRHTPERYVTTSPQQALFMLNNPFMLQCARELALRAGSGRGRRPDRGIEALYRLVFQRTPSRAEVELGERYLRSCGGSDEPSHASSAVEPAELSRWERYAQALLMTNELSFVD